MRLTTPLMACVLVAGPALCSEPKDSTVKFVFLGKQRPILVHFDFEVDGKEVSTVWKESMRAVFNFVDANADGKVTVDEFKQAPAPQLLGANLYIQTPRPVNPHLTADVNKDGSISFKEFADYYRSSGLSLFEYGGNPAWGTWAFPNGGSYYTRGGTIPSRSAQVNAAFFKHLDRNNDKRLSEPELKKAEAVFRKLDRNDDELISMSELLGSSGDQSQMYLDGELRIYPQGGMATAAEKRFVRYGDSGTPAKTLMQHYARSIPNGRKSEVDLKKAEFKKAIIQKLDEDRDGRLDEKELVRYGDSLPDLHFKIDVGKRTIKLFNPKHASKSVLVRSSKQDRIIVEIDHETVQFSPDTGKQFAGLAFVESVYTAQFQTADQDNNGYLDKNEAKRNGVFGPLFETLDRDNDDKVFPKELTSYLKTINNLRSRMSRTCVRLSFSDRGKGMFDLVDERADDQLSIRELRQMRNLLRRIDRNSDRHLEQDEIPTTFDAVIRYAQHDYGILTIDASGLPLLQQGNAMRTDEGPAWFRRMDINQDGDVSRREFLGSKKVFDNMDSDHDGLLSASEAIAADKKLRK